MLFEFDIDVGDDDGLLLLLGNADGVEESLSPRISADALGEGVFIGVGVGLGDF